MLKIEEVLEEAGVPMGKSLEEIPAKLLTGSTLSPLAIGATDVFSASLSLPPLAVSQPQPAEVPPCIQRLLLEALHKV